MKAARAGESRSDSTEHRHSQQRDALLAMLARRKDHPTARELHAEVCRRLPHVSLATVYRNLELFVQQGLAVKLQVPGGEARFDGKRGHHGHVRCVKCGRIADIPARRLPLRASPVRKVAGFRILEIHVDLRGLCPECGREQRRS